MRALEKLRNKVPLAVGVAVSGLFLWFALREADLPRIIETLRYSKPWFALPLLGTLAGFYWLKALRWRMLLSPVLETSTLAVVPAMMIGFAGNNVLPAHLGELVRMHVLARQHGLSRSAVLATIAVERAFDFVTVLLLVGAVLLVGVRVSPALATAGYFIAGAGVGALILALLYVGWSDAFVAVCRQVLWIFPKRVQLNALRQLELGAAGLAAVKRRSLLLGAVWSSLLQWVLMALCLYMAILAVGVTVPLSSAFVLLALNVAGLTLPSAPGYFGTIELCFVLALRPYAVDDGQAFAAAVFYHILAYLAVTITGLTYLHRLGWTFRRMGRNLEQMSPAAAPGARPKSTQRR
jgi:uncharacterized protein (TIRG00374 family)